MTTEASTDAFNRGMARGTKLELVRAVAVAKAAYWDALKRLEEVLTDGAGFSDRANNEVIDEIDSLAVGPSEGTVYEAITETSVDVLEALVKAHPIEE